MASVELNAGGRYVKIVQDGRDAELLLPLAEKAWGVMSSVPDEKPGGAMGFRDDKRWTPDVDALSPGGYGSGFSAPVKAEGGAGANPV